MMTKFIIILSVFIQAASWAQDSDDLSSLASEPSRLAAQESENVPERRFVDVRNLGEGVFLATGRSRPSKNGVRNPVDDDAAIIAAEFDAFLKLSAMLHDRDPEVEVHTPDFHLIQIMIIERTHVYLKGITILDIRVDTNGFAEVDVELKLDEEERNALYGAYVADP